MPEPKATFLPQNAIFESHAGRLLAFTVGLFLVFPQTGDAMDSNVSDNRFYNLIKEIGDMRATQTDNILDYTSLLDIPFGSNVAPFISDLEALGFKASFGTANREHYVGFSVSSQTLRQINPKFFRSDEMRIGFYIDIESRDAHVSRHFIKIFGPF